MVDDIFTTNSYNTVDFESESFDIPQKSRSHLNLMPAVKQFAIRNGYEVGVCVFASFLPLHHHHVTSVGGARPMNE